MAQLSLYYRTQLETKVSVFPEQLDGDIDNHILDNLRAKVEGKSGPDGIVLKIIRLIECDNGVIDKANFMGTSVSNVKYECFICSPTKKQEIVCVFENVIKGYIIGRNGPIIVAIEMNLIDSQHFEVRNGKIIYLKTGKELEKGEYLKVSIINIKSNLNEKIITTVCKLLNVANKKEIESFKNDKKMITGTDEDDETEFI